MERLEIYFYCCRPVFSNGILLRSDGLLSKIFNIFWSMLNTGDSGVDISGGDLPRPLCGSSPMPPKAPLPCSWCALTPQKSRPRLLQCIWTDHQATSSYALLPKSYNLPVSWALYFISLKIDFSQGAGQREDVVWPDFNLIFLRGHESSIWNCRELRHNIVNVPSSRVLYKITCLVIVPSYKRDCSLISIFLFNPKK